ERPEARPHPARRNDRVDRASRRGGDPRCRSRPARARATARRGRGPPRRRGRVPVQIVTSSRGVRVIAGRARGRRLAVPPGPDVRPTKDMVREAVFSALASRNALVDASVLDLYAGSGALGIEALSRGAARAGSVGPGRAAAATAPETPEGCRFADHSRVVRGAVEASPRAPAPGEAPFTLVLADPPYGVADNEVDAVLQMLDA